MVNEKHVYEKKKDVKDAGDNLKKSVMKSMPP